MQQQLFLESQAVVEFIKTFSFRKSILSIKHDNTTIIDILQDLSSQIYKAQDAEHEFLKSIEVKNLAELQARLDAANEDKAISNLQNVKINEQHSLGVENNDTSSSTIVQVIKQAINKESLDDDSINNLAIEIANQMANETESYYSGNKHERSSKKKNNDNSLFDKNKLADELAKAFKKGGQKIQSKQYSKDFRKMFIDEFINQAKNIEINGGTIKIDYTNFGAPNALPKKGEQLKSYPYYNLTEKDQKIALNDVDLWERFKDFMSKESLDHKKIIKDSIEEIGRKEIISKSQSYNDLIGIMGELQALCFFKIVLGNKEGRLKHTALERKNGKQLDIDILLNNIGIQVKNYKAYSHGKGYHIRQDLTWSQLESEERYGSNNQQFNDIKQFFITRAYNQPISKAQQWYKDFYGNFSKTGVSYEIIKSYFASTLNKILPLRTVYELTEDADALDTDSVFWLFGGEFIVPTSVILQCILDRIIDFLDLRSTYFRSLPISNKPGYNERRENNYAKIMQTLSMYPISENKGENLKWSPEVRVNPDKAPSVQEVLDAIQGLHFDFNISIGDLKRYIDKQVISSSTIVKKK